MGGATESTAGPVSVGVAAAAVGAMTASVAKTGIGAFSTGAGRAWCVGGGVWLTTGTSAGGGTGATGTISGSCQRGSWRTASLRMGACDSGISSSPAASACRAMAVL